MKRMLPTIAAGLLLAALPGWAHANDADDNAVERGAKTTGHAIKKGAEATGDAIERGAEATGHAIKKGAEATGEALGISKSDEERYGAIARGTNRVTGKVTAIDHDEGLVTLATDSATLRLHFPEDALKDVSRGDRLTVESAYAIPTEEPPADSKSTRPRVAGDQPLRGDHWMTGTVTGVHASTGVVDVKTDDAPLAIQFAPTAARTLKEGDKIVVELAFTPAAAK